MRRSGTRARINALPWFKRAIDITVSALLLVVLLPAIALIALLVILDSPGPVFYRSSRVGRSGRPLRMLKFRKMRDGATGLALTLDDDERFTRIGKCLAANKLDEIPQFWHVLRGEMSLVGPRPEAEVFVSEFASDYHTILKVRPGIFGLSQLAYAREGRILNPANPADHYVSRILPQKLAIDRLYVERQSLSLDLNILFWSAAAVLLHQEVAVDRATAKLSRRQRRAATACTSYERTLT